MLPVVNESNLGRTHGKVEHFPVNLCAELLGIFLLNLAALEHTRNETRLTKEQEILSSSVLICLAHFGEILFNMHTHMFFSCFRRCSALLQNLRHIRSVLFSLNCRLKRFPCVVMAVYEAQHYIVRQ